MYVSVFSKRRFVQLRERKAEEKTQSSGNVRHNNRQYNCVDDDDVALGSIVNRMLLLNNKTHRHARHNRTEPSRTKTYTTHTHIYTHKAHKRYN